MNLYGVPRNSAAYTIPFARFFSFFFNCLCTILATKYKFPKVFCYWLDTWILFEGIRNSVYMNLYGIPRNFVVLYRKNFTELNKNKHFHPKSHTSNTIFLASGELSLFLYAGAHSKAEISLYFLINMINLSQFLEQKKFSNQFFLFLFYFFSKQTAILLRIFWENHF